MNYMVIVLASQLLFYLIVIQTGVVGALNSDLNLLFTLPLGGMFGSLMVAYLEQKNVKIQLYILFGMQIILGINYPNYNLFHLFVLGFIAGYTTPLLLHIFKEQTKIALMVGLGTAYVLGTALYGMPFESRGIIAVIFPLVSLLALFVDKNKDSGETKGEGISRQDLIFFVLWIFLDTVLFETLNRGDERMDIWAQYGYIIAVSHILGLVLAYHLKATINMNRLVVIGLFSLSYVLYYVGLPMLLAVIYPIVISYYNFILFSKMVKINDIRIIGMSMFVIGWVSTSLANVIALNKLIMVVPWFLFFSFLYILFEKNKK